MTTSPTRWGIIATGGIARSFATDLREVPGAELVATGSRNLASAEAFTAEFGGRPHASYAGLVADEEVDIVYVASPHAMHLEHATMALEAGKPVLCEKPLAMSVAEDEQLIAVAERTGLFLMEAMWTACHPAIRLVTAGLREGRFGTPRSVHADIGFVVPADPDGRMWDPRLGASALLDMGIYPLTLAHLVLGEAEQLQAVAVLDERGVDVDVAIAGRYPGAVVALSASMTSATPGTATIATDQGRLDLGPDFFHPEQVWWHPLEGEPELIVSEEPVLGLGLGNEALHVQECLAQGLRQSPLVPHEMTLTLARQMEHLRASFAG